MEKVREIEQETRENTQKVKEIIEKITKNKLIKAEVITIIASIILGTTLHFTYRWSGGNSFVAIFSAVNESVWEHLKLTFFAMMIVSIFEYFSVSKIVHNYIEAKVIGTFVAICFIVVSFFTYTGIIGVSFLIIDIILFIIAITLGEYVAYRLMTREDESNLRSKILAIGIAVFLLICFITFSFIPPRVNLFKDPSTRTIWKNK